MSIVQQFNLNMIPQTIPEIVSVNQYDTGIGRLVAKLYKNGTQYLVSSGTAIVQGTKPDKKGFQYSASISGNTVTIDLTEQMSAVPGDVMCQVVVTESTGKTGTFIFILRVQPSALQDNVDISETVLPEYINAAQLYALRAELAAGTYPYIDDTTHNWMVYDAESGNFVDTGINATGDFSVMVLNSCLYFNS